MALGTFSNSGMGFGVSFTLKDMFSATANKIEGEMASLGTATDKIADKINSSFGKVAAGAAMVGAGIGLLSPIGVGIKLAAEFEATNIAFETMLGSAEKAKVVMAEIDALAAKTPFELPQVEKAYKQLLVFGVPTEKLQNDFVALGNISSGVGADIDRLITAFGQVKGKGLLKGDEFKQFSEAGVDLGQMLRDIGVQFDLTKQDVGDMKIPFEKVEEAILKAAGSGGKFDGLMEKLSNTTSGKISNIGDNLSRTMRTVGQSIEGFTKPALDTILFALSKIEAFIKTKAGKWVVGFVVLGMGLAALTLVGVGLVMMFEAMAGVLATVVGAMKFIVIEIVTFVGLLYLLWAAIDSGSNSLMIFASLITIGIMGPLGLLVIGVMVVFKAFKDFNNFMESGMKGPATWFVKLGAVMSFIMEVFSSMSDEGFTLSENLETALKQIGIFEFAIAIATWIGRIRSFFIGIWEGISEGAAAIFGVFQAIFGYFDSLIDSLGFFDTSLLKNSDSLDSWKQMGVYAGYAIAAVLAVLAIDMAILSIAWAAAGVAMIVSWFPIIALVAAIIAIVWAAIWVFNHWGEIVTWVGQLIWGTLTRIGDGFMWLMGFLFGLPAMMFNWGVDFVLNIWEGIKSMWGSLVDWLTSMMTGIWDTVTAPFKWLGNKIGLGGGEGEGNLASDVAGTVTDATTKQNSLDTASNTMADTFGQQFATRSSNTVTNNNSTIQPFNVQLVMDGDMISQKMIDKQEMNKARE